MPVYDLQCNSCAEKRIDVYEPVNTPPHHCACGGLFERTWFAHPPTVIGDEIDVTIKHGLCNLDGTPRRWRSREALRKEEKKRGIFPRVEHVGAPGSDKSKVTVRWT